MNKILTISGFSKRQHQYKDGILHEVKRIAFRVEGDIVELTEEQFQHLRKNWRKPFGLGDAVASMATPIARALKMDCIDPATKNLKPESGCAKRKAALNKIHLPSL